MSEIDVWMCDPIGTRVLPLVNFDRLTFTRAVNAVGELEIVLPGTFAHDLVRVDGQIQVWRDGRLDTETAWLIRVGKRTTDAQGVSKVILTGVSGVDLLRRRIVRSPNPFTAAADNQMKAYVRENLGALATDTARQLPATLFTVATDTTAAPVTTQQVDWLNLLSVCQDIAKDSAELGTALFFDVVFLPEPNLWEFRTYTGARGVDKSSTTGAPQTLSVEYGSIGAEELVGDYRDEVTVVYVGGGGEGAQRAVGMVEDTSRSGRSVYGRAEAFVSATSLAQPAELEGVGRPELQRGRPWRSYVADTISTSASQYGRDWNFGDIVTVYAFDQQFDCRVDAVQVTIDNLDGGREQVRVRLTNTAAV